MRMTRLVAVTLAVLIPAIPLAAFQASDQPTDITPTDVYREVQGVAHDVEQLRFYMGRPTNTQVPIDVSGVAPREVIYQAATLCEKVNRLAFELIREVAEKPVVPNRQIVPADVLRMVSFAHGQVQRIASDLDLQLAPPPAPSADTRTPTDVYQSIVQLNRQVNLLLDRGFSPSDVFEEVSLAIAHAASLRSRWPGERIPQDPTWELGKRPADVLQRLVHCFELVRAIAQDENLQVLMLRVSVSSLEGTTPSDVYDIASLLVAELAYLDRTLVTTSATRTARYPGRKVPSDVYQRAGILLLQLEGINVRVEAGAGQGGS